VRAARTNNRNVLDKVNPTSCLTPLGIRAKPDAYFAGMSSAQQSDMDLIDRKSSEPGTSEFDPEIQWRLYLSGLPSYLDSRIRGQSLATGKIARAVQAAELGLNDSGNRPKCSFLFLGPTGVGKTESTNASITIYT